MFRTLFALGAFLLIASPAQAQLEICNKTTGEVAVAVAYDSEQDTISEGWTKIAPTACAEVIATPLSQPYYYFYAITKAQSMQWTGPYRFCAADETNFRIKGASGCEERGYRTLGFSQFSVGNFKTFTFNIRSAAAPAAATNEPPVTEAAPPAAADPLADMAPPASAPVETAPVKNTPVENTPVENAPAAATGDPAAAPTAPAVQ